MRNSFERFGIDHLSPSSLNLWRASPGVWALRYVAKLKDEGKATMWRGSAVEVGMAALLHGETIDKAIVAAQTSFDLNAMGIINDDNETERALIEPMLLQCAKWKAPSNLNAIQLRVEYFFDPVPVPVVGYLDFAFDGIDIDLKTTKACPSTPRADNVRQVSLYRAARGRSGGLLYVTDKRQVYYEVTDEMMDEALLEMSAAALSLNNFLARMNTREDVLRSLPVDFDHWSAPKTKVPLSEILTAG